MSVLASIDPLFVLSGFGVGLLVGQTGVGGGALMTPLLVLLFGIHPATAVGTDLLYAAATKSVGTLVHGAHGTVDWRITGRLAAGSVPATVVMMLVMSRYNLLDSSTERLFAVCLGVALMATGVALLLRSRILALTNTWADSRSPAATTALTVLAGAVLGVLVSISSVGAGAIGMTVLILLYPRHRLVTLVGSDIAHAVPLTLVAGIGHWMVGSVDFTLLLALLCGSIPGIMLGSALSARIPEWVLRPVLAVVLLGVGMRLAI
jgi:uncharacterized membrane protein YfcA